MTVFAGARVVTRGGVLDPGWLRIDAGRIAAVGAGEPPEPADVRLPGRWLVPGFVDVHVHGGGGATFASGDHREVGRVLRFHREHGTTTAVASLVSAPLPELERALDRLADLVADGLLAGVHLEGPFLSHTHCGAHDPRLLRPPHGADVARLLAAGRDAIRMVTLAPELDGGLDAVRRVVDAGAVAAVGHTGADYACARAAIDAGARAATHLFNGMPPVHHREPGPAVALLDDPRVTLEAINDGVHLHPATLRLVVAAAGARRTALITDAIAAAGLGDQDVSLGPLQVTVRDGVARVPTTGSLAGSTLTMDAAVRRAVHDAGLPIEDAIAMAATTPARLLGLDDRIGTIAPGLDADLVVLDADLTVERVFAKGVG
ncbi:N-acetylglucosamine-6-phosphate deacetylase [Pseudonocardia nigra]|uniref:N-acetylglucosamine-6-phosphate deacetylase n=1 Tax=Pseudonocardia nigra TaxID=1921578 RepID=UPI001C6021D3|nr:N-acetylglucosamine-6-phosphate deacetylase [Pseudonocardia nigra]